MPNSPTWSRLPHRRPSRRQALVVGATGFAGLTLADVLRAEAAAGVGSSVKSVINVHLDGGPPQHDTIDPKPDAPEEVRGEFAPIATALPGLRISELMPKVAAALPTGSGSSGRLSGRPGPTTPSSASPGSRPQTSSRSAVGRRLGSVVTKLHGSPDDPVPTFVDLMQGRPLVRNSARAGFLGQACGPFRPDISRLFARELEPGMKNELAARGADHTIRLTLADGLTFNRLDDRMQLLNGFDDTRRDLDATGAMDAMDRFNRQAMNILTSGRLAEALDLEKEPAHVHERYTPPVGGGEKFYTAEDGTAAKKLLLARRLIEAGVRCVSVSFSDFDTHSKNFPRMRQLVPIVDHALHALVTDLDSRGLLDDVVIVAWGEFGRTPRVNANGGRDHWPEVGPALLVGGGLSGGRVVGATDRLGGKVVSRPVSYQEVFATLYHCLGIAATRTTVPDPTGRPQHLLDRAEPIRELLS